MSRRRTPVYDPAEILWTSDLHFFHKSIAKDWRPFGSVDVMHEALITNWNEHVDNDSHIFVLGDFSMGKTNETIDVIKQLRGNIHFIKGNHDKGMKAHMFDMFASVHDYLEIDVLRHDGEKQRICMMHYPLASWNKHHYGSWMLHGHCHGNLEPIGKSLDVGVDPNDFYPVDYHMVEAYMAQREIHTNDHHKVKHDGDS